MIQNKSKHSWTYSSANNLYVEDIFKFEMYHKNLRIFYKHFTSQNFLTMGLSLTSNISFSFVSLWEDCAISAMAAVAAAAAVREDERRLVLAGERDRLRRRPGERERERVRVWKAAKFCGKTTNKQKIKLKNHIKNTQDSISKNTKIHQSSTNICIF